MILPNFLIVGAMKAGTTTLADYLHAHPSLKISSQEIHFFDRDINYKKGLDWYSKKLQGFSYYLPHSLKISNPEQCYYGDKTPTYSYKKKCAKRIKETLPRIKIIWSFRDPSIRVYSNYLHAKRNGGELLDFREAVNREKERIKSNIFWGYVERSKYAVQVKRFLEFFDKKQMHFMLFEDFLKNKQKELKKVTDFLSVNPLGENLPEFHSNKTKMPFSYKSLYYSRQIGKRLGPPGKLIYYSTKGINLILPKPKPQIPPDIKEELDEYFVPYNEKLAKLTGLDLSSWDEN
ncbi:MAG: sulfotransferase [Deltaproteobacteria bacterium]|nr:sulfotransferase [Deltaproteobacteria bacterium]